MMYVVMYLSAIVIANLLVAQFGASITILNAFLFIGLDLTARDALHERWRHQNLWLKMALLISIGSILSALLNTNATNIAIASFAAFCAAGVVDALSYHLLSEYGHLTRINSSNFLSAGIDSILFPMLAFGFPILWGGCHRAVCGKGSGWIRLVSDSDAHSGEIGAWIRH